MIGAVLVVIAVVFVLPSLMLLTGMAVSAIFGWSLKNTAEDDHAGSELIQTNY